MTADQDDNNKAMEDRIQKEFSPEQDNEEAPEKLEELSPLPEVDEDEPVLGATEELEPEPVPEYKPVPEDEVVDDLTAEEEALEAATDARRTEEGELPARPTPVYLLDDPPEGKTNLIKWGLMHGMDEDYLKQEGYNPRSIDICAQELEKAGFRKRPKKQPGTTAVTKTGSKSAQIFAKGSPPEALIDALEIPMDGKLEGFDQGMRFGASVIVLGVRIVQELSALGVQQTKPLIDVANSMRQGEALAAKNAAGEAAMEAAGMVRADMMPLIASLQKGTEGPDPVKAMMVRTMEPMIQGMMKTLMPGMPQGDTMGWTRKQS